MRRTKLIMPGKFKYKDLTKHPQVVGEDTEVWNRFVLNFPDRFDTVDYDVPVGEVSKTYYYPDEISHEHWKNLTKKRIDVIGYKNNSATIIEVNKKVSLSTLGHIIVYRSLYRFEHPEIYHIKVLIICSTISHDGIFVLNHHAINFVIV
jgi:hypothetical protein